MLINLAAEHVVRIDFAVSNLSPAEVRTMLMDFAQSVMERDQPKPVVKYELWLGRWVSSDTSSKLNAMKTLRGHLGIGLKESVDMIDHDREELVIMKSESYEKISQFAKELESHGADVRVRS